MTIKKAIISLSFLLLVIAPFSELGAAEMPDRVKNILIYITASLAGHGPGIITGDFDEMKVKSEDTKMTSSSTSVSSVQLYFPMNNGDVKYYEGTVLGSSYNATYSYSQIFYNGRTCYLEQDSLDGSRSYYGYSGNALQIYGAQLENENFPLDTPLTVLNDSILNDGGTIHSNTTLNVEGYVITLSLSVTSTLTGSVTIPLGAMDDCRTIDMAFSYSIPGESESLDIRDVWVLAPNIGKLKIAVVDQFLVNRGWLNITGGKINSQSVIEIISPTIADFEADFRYGLAPLTVQFTDLSSGMITGWSWVFGDGTQSSSKNPTHIYSEPGLYGVSLTVLGAGVSNTETKPAYIRAYPAEADLNNDHKIDLEDTILVLQLLAGIDVSVALRENADVNEDGIIGIEEAIFILQVLLGNR